MSAVDHRGEFLHIEEVRTAEILVALGDLGVDRRGVYGNVNGAGGWVLRYGDGAVHLVEAATHSPDDMMPGAEEGEAVIRVDLVGPRRGERRGRRLRSLSGNRVDGQTDWKKERASPENAWCLSEDHLSSIAVTS